MKVAEVPALTVAAAVARAEAEIAAVTDTVRLEAELILAEATGLGRAAIVAHPERMLAPDQALYFDAAIARRRSGEPLAYILGRREFYSLSLGVGPAVLVPRPETETLVEAALERLSAQPGQRVLDLGTGSGAIALALRRERSDIDVTAVDIEPDALALARRNAAALDLELRFLESDWYAAVAGERFDMIVSNPPYVASSDRHFDGPLAREPRIALDGGPDGLDAYRSILAGSAGALTPGGQLLVEHGYDQREAVIALADASGLVCEAALDDLAGLARVACFRLRAA